MGWEETKRARQLLSREQGTVFKDWGGRIPIALIYPNSYYVGMSNLGFHTIYGLLNSYDNVVCERVFYHGGTEKPFSLESQRPLRDFALLAFSITYELDYFNAVQMLKAGGIPLLSAERDERYPLVIAGGPCITANPQPLSPIFDCLAIGEGEAILPPMLQVLAEEIYSSRDNLLQALTSVPGAYVPRCYRGAPVVRQWAGGLDRFATTSVVLTPNTELGKLYLMEIARGCGWGCRFCLASYAFRPVRFRSVDRLLAQARVGLKYRRRLGLVGAGESDHPQIEELVIRLREMGADFSLSSLRVKPLSCIVLRELAQSGAKTVTLAPEVGSERLQQVIRKGITEDDVFEAVEMVAEQGFQQLKLYFMIGLPTETEEDILGIVRLTQACRERIQRRRSATRITLNIAPFVPKAGTPFQWLAMAPPDVLSHRLSLLRSNLSGKGIKIKSESAAWSQVQGVLARGDAGVASVLARMEGNSLSAWRRAVKDCQLDVDFYAHREWAPGDSLPWEMIDLGTSPGYLELEMARAQGHSL